MQFRQAVALTAAVLALTAAVAGAEPLQPTAEQRQHHLELFRKGAALWPIYCNHCPDARDPAEFAPYQLGPNHYPHADHRERADRKRRRDPRVSQNRTLISAPASRHFSTHC